ncbi:MAG: hypothetical protein AB1467_02015 [Candidatus Diapherotrites archaeon]
MAEVRLEKDKAAILLGRTEFDRLGLSEKKDYEIIKAKEDLFLLIGKPLPMPRDSSLIDKRLFSLLDNRKILPKRVEGKFEKLLSKEELQRFQELLKLGVIEKFRLSEKYKKPIYRIKEKKKEQMQAQAQAQAQAIQSQQQAQQQAQTQKPVQATIPSTEPRIEKEGFAVIKSDFDAKKFCYDYEAEIKANQIKGLKGFDGNHYFIKVPLLERLKQKILSAFKQKKNLSLKELSDKASLDQKLAKCCCEFLKEEGELLEKRKEQYEAIE